MSPGTRDRAVVLLRGVNVGGRSLSMASLRAALTDDAVFSHCLPLRRNVKATDAVMDSPQCIAINEAENRLHVQKAIMAALIRP